MAYRYRISEIKLQPGDDRAVIPRLIERKTGLRTGTLGSRANLEAEMRPGAYIIKRESIDARNKPEIKFVYTVEFELERPLRNEKRAQRIAVEARTDVPEGEKELTGRPVVTGFGPCGIFAALELARRGYRPLVVERGSSMEKRIADVERFRTTGVLDPESNMLFGEGGAGTFSDGKLASGIRNDNVRYVLEVFHDAGADDDILYKSRPHIGTDVLRRVIVNIRKKIEDLGGEVLFDTEVADLILTGSELSGVLLRQRNGETREVRTNALILAVGHSARDTFSMVHGKGIAMEQKPISIGVRIEHPQSLIDEAQYGREAVEKYDLPPAEYKLSYHTGSGRGVYSFCMCPGGEVVVCSTSDRELCVNGMSNRLRDSGTANSGILCDVRCEDYGAGDPLAGVRFQQKYERLAYQNAHTGDGGWKAPSCSMAAFMSGAGNGEEPAADTLNCRRVTDSLPAFAVDAIREAIPHFAARIAGYDDGGAVVTAVETRSSSPVRILRGEDGMSSVTGVFPAGEGAGYAGGITSAACDGIRAAERLISVYSK